MKSFRFLFVLFSFFVLFTAAAQPGDYEAYYSFNNDLDILKRAGQTVYTNDLDGTAQGSPISALNRLSADDAIYFDGSDDGFTIHQSLLSGEANFTIALWLKFSFNGQASQYRTILTKTGGDLDQFELKARNNKCVFEAYDTNGDAVVTLSYGMSGADLSDGGWHHVVIALSGTEAKMYVDGAAEEESALTGYNSTSTSVISVAVPTGSDKYFEGSMDELRFYKRALSHEEVIEIGEATTFKSFKTTVFGNEIDGVIDSINHTVSVVVPYNGTSATNSYQLHTGASVGTIDPLNTSSLPKSITITDHDSDEQIWTINAPDYESDIVSFSISGQLLTSEIDAANHTVSLYMPYDTDLSSLTPTIAVSPDAVISPVSGGVQDFSDEFIYTVTALDGEAQLWTVTVTKHDGIVTSYELDGDVADASIYQNDGTLAGTPAYTTDRLGTTASALTFDGTDDYISTGLMPELAASLNSFSVNFWMRTDNTTEIDRIFGTNSTGNSQYLFATLNYDGTNTVAGTIQLALRDLDGNTSFISVNDAILVDGDWHMLTLIVNNAANNDIDIYVDGVENTSETVSGIGASNFGSFDNDFLIGALNAQGTPSDFFTGDLDEFEIINHAITGGEITSRYEADDWTETNILTFAITNQAPGTNIDIDEIDHEVFVTLDYGTTLATPTFTLSPNATSSPLSGVQQDFSDGEVYTISTKDGQYSQDWTVNVIYAANTATDITSFTISENVVVGPSVINATNHTVLMSVFDGADLSSITPTITLSDNATINPQSGVIQDFKSPVTYTITAEDGSMQEWIISAEVNLLGNYVYYPFSGNDDDASGNDLHGSSLGGMSTPTLTQDRFGVIGTAYDFDGNDIIELSSDLLNGSLQGTLAAWVNFSDISQGGSGTRTIIGKGGSTDSQFGLFANNNAFIFEAYRNGSGTYLEITYHFNNEGIYDYSNGEWHHVAVTFSPTEAILYMNGEEKGRDNTTNGVYTHTSNNEVTICDWGSGQNDPFEGSIDEVFISNEAMTERSIYSLFDPTSFLTFSLPNAISTTFIENDKADQDTIKIVMPAGTTVNGAAPTFTIPPGAEAKVVGAEQESEVTTQNFLENVTYTVGVPGGTVTKDWVVIVDVPPTITSITYSSATVGTSLTIAGANFSNDAEVYFGGVQASVTQVRATSIEADVPLGASLAPISVLSNGLYAEYSQDFNLTFDSPDLDSLLFDKEQLIDRPASTMVVRLADFDADRSNDILIASADKISVHKIIFVQDVNDQLNIQLSPTLSFEYPVITTKESVEIADFNGDGFTDFAVIDQGKNVMIFLNQSSGQPFTFSDPINLGINENGGSTILKVADFNTDGRYDILVNDDGNVMVFQNTGEVSGTLDFDSLTVAVPNLYFKEIEIVDLDLDGKKDLLIIDKAGAAYIFRNISEPSGNSTFAAMQTISLPAEFTPLSIATTDLDGDSKADVAVMGMESVIVLPNASTGVGNISFDSPIDLSKVLENGNISLGDLDGDGKVDLVASTSLDPNVTNYEGALSLYKNTSVSGAISFEPEVLLPRTDFHVSDIAIVDLDNDTRSEIIGVGADKLLILMNTKTDKELFSLDIAGQVSSTFKDAVDTDIDSVVVVMPYGTSVLALKPDFLVSPGATVSPDTTVARGFAEPVTFTITAEDNTTKEWLVIVEAESNTWTGTSWSEGSPPTNIHNAIIAAAYNFSENGSFAANNLTVNNETALVVNGEGTLDVKGDLSNMGSLIVESGASLITYSDKTISNNIVIKRNTRYEGGKYSFVGSPMTMDENIVTSILGPIVYSYDESQSYGENDGLDRWVRQNNEILIPSKGYAQARQKEIAFTGAPNDGTVTIVGTYSGTANDVINDASEGWTLVANPYPAAIGVNAFLTENDNIAGAVYIWDDNGSNTGRGSNSDYIIANAVEAINTEPTPAGGASRYNLHLGSAQGFFVKLLGTGDNEIVFTEDMRVSGSNSDDNFFRKTTIPKIRLNLTDEQGLFKQTLVGWVDGIDDNRMNRLYDAPVFNPNMMYGVYSVKQNMALAIQGISYKSQGVEIGYNVAEAGTYHLQLDASEYSEKLYLFDKKLLTTVPMTETGYSFYTTEGPYTERFQLLTSPIDVLQAWVEELTVYSADNVLYLNIPITNQKQQVFTLHDLTGKLVRTHKTLQTTTVDLNGLTPGVYLVRQVDGELSYKIIVK